MRAPSTRQTITEPAREIEICREADVVVVGGGPGGIGSALSAARSGADTALVERYGHLGGMATGGLVTIIPNLSDISGEQQITGICQELVDRLDARGATDYPKKEDWGSTDEKLVQHYIDANLAWFYIRDDLNIGRKRVLYTALIDPEIMKCELNNMMEEAGVKLYLHSWGARPIVDGNTVKGVIIENKSGRQAILAKVVIDSTGDGDLLQPAGAECDTRMVPGLRIAAFAFPFWIGNINMKKLEDFRASQTKKYDELMQDLGSQGGAAFYLKDFVKCHD
jgi:flavin-dependent dehydrogenase